MIVVKIILLVIGVLALITSYHLPKNSQDPEDKKPENIYNFQGHLYLKKNLNLSIFCFVVFFFMEGGSSKETVEATEAAEVSVESTEGSSKCLVGFDWVYPSSDNPTGAWKFSSDGTFTSSTTFFGGMSTWGNWEVISPGKIKISYTRTTEGIIPADQILTMSSCSSLEVGSTVYSKD